MATEQKYPIANELNFKFSWDERISEYDSKPVWGNYHRQTRTITIFLGTFGESFRRIKDSSLLEFVMENGFSKTIQEECLHACIEDIRERVEREKEEWIIDRIEEMVKQIS